MPELNHYLACLVDEPTIEALDREAQRADRSRSYVVREALADHLEHVRAAEAEAQAGASP